VFGPFKTYLAQTVAAREHDGRNTVAPDEVASVTRRAWDKATTPENIMAGFRKTGIWPHDPSKITPDIYKQGALFRDEFKDEKENVTLPLPCVPLATLDLLPPSSFSISASHPRIESVSTILAPPAALTSPAPSTRKPPAISTRFATMLTEDEVRNKLHEHEVMKAEQDKKKQDNKRKKEEKQKQKQATATTTTTKLHKSTLRLIPKSTNKENTHPNIREEVDDPYAFNTKL
jgi:hypothetical protein